MVKPLQEQVIVITGASSGIGRLTALRAAEQGAKVVLAARSQEALVEAAREIEGLPGEALVVPTDVSSYEQVEELGRRAVERFGRIDTWVNDASVAVYAAFVDTDNDEFRHVMDVNLMGTVYGCRVALQHMQAEGGTIINVSSVEGERGMPLHSAYAASKHAVVGLSDALRTELMHDGIPVNVTVIKPASINTPFFRHAKTKLGVQPGPFPPVYAPDLVADAILHAATHAVRDLVVGDAGNMIIRMDQMSPSALDQTFARVGYRLQQTDVPKSEDDANNLYEGISHNGEVYGEFKSMPISPLTTLQKHPELRWGLIALGLTWALMKQRNGRRHERQPYALPEEETMYQTGPMDMTPNTLKVADAVHHSPTRLESLRDEREDRVEQESDESFPASDPPSWTPTTALGQPGRAASTEEATWTSPNAVDRTAVGSVDHSPTRLESLREEPVDRVEQESDESFPASDPPSWTPTTALGQPARASEGELPTWTTPNQAERAK